MNDELYVLNEKDVRGAGQLFLDQSMPTRSALHTSTHKYVSCRTVSAGSYHNEYYVLYR